MGCSGSGKSTLARELELGLGYPRLELDSYFHLPEWGQKPDQQFKAEVTDFLEQSEHSNQGWIVDGNYLSKLEHLVISRADIVIWFNLPRRVVMWRVIKRSLRRAITREELWNGNRESLRNLMKWDPEENIVRWSWTKHQEYSDELSALAVNSSSASKQLWLEIKDQRDLAEVKKAIFTRRGESA